MKRFFTAAMVFILCIGTMDLFARGGRSGGFSRSSGSSRSFSFGGSSKSKSSSSSKRSGGWFSSSKKQHLRLKKQLSHLHQRVLKKQQLLVLSQV